jgi:hypothetical protein
MTDNYGFRESAMVQESINRDICIMRRRESVVWIGKRYANGAVQRRE